MSIITAHIMAIGDEILYGQTLDTNSHYIAQQLSVLNINLIEISVIPDNEDAILTTLKNSKADIIITTGGLGPTKDDKTKLIMAHLLDKDLIINQEALEWIEAYYKRVTKRPMNALNKDQALAPEGSELLRNEVGTAPGIWSVWNNKTIINLPGVPYEMKYLMVEEVLPRIQKHFNSNFLIHHFIPVIGIPESELAIKLEPIEDELPPHIKLAYLPTSKMVKLRLSSTGTSKDFIEEELRAYANKITALIPHHVIKDNNKDVLSAIASILNKKQWMLATAESFTSGRIAAQITSKAGSSSYFKGGIIAYSPALKIDLLNIPSNLIKENGVVNEKVAEQMAIGALERTGADVAISSTGVAGPTADEFGVQPGTAFLGFATQETTKVLKFTYERLDRFEFTEKLTQLAIQELYSFIKDL